MATPTALAAPAATEVPPADEAPYGVEAELAWARARWPAQLARVSTGSHARELLAWMEGAEREVWFTRPSEARGPSTPHRCLPAKLSRIDGGDQLYLRVRTGESGAPGRRKRTYTDGSAGHVLLYGDGGSEEVEQPDGTWQTEGGWGTSDVDSFVGVLSEVSGDVARFAGTLIDLQASCAGPLERVACRNGATQECDTCRNVTVSFKPRPFLVMGHAGTITTRTYPCDPCPATTHSDLERAERLFAHLEAWAMPAAPTAPSAALYRSRQSCLADGRNGAEPQGAPQR